METSACRSFIPSICPKTSNAHSSKPWDLIDSVALLSFSLYFGRTADAAFVNFYHVAPCFDFAQKIHFALNSNDGCDGFLPVCV